jgi:hypothetical protein
LATCDAVGLTDLRRGCGAAVAILGHGVDGARGIHFTKAVVAAIGNEEIAARIERDRTEAIPLGVCGCDAVAVLAAGVDADDPCRSDLREHAGAVASDV